LQRCFLFIYMTCYCVHLNGIKMSFFSNEYLAGRWMSRLPHGLVFPTGGLKVLQVEVSFDRVASVLAENCKKQKCQSASQCV
jgi:hypothetical protein